MLNITRPICFIDIETTGVDVFNDRIVEISILKYHPDGTREIKTKLINPEIPIPKEASDIHGITDERIANEPTFKQLSAGMLSFISGCDFAGYNSNSFDYPFIYNEFFRAGINWDYKQSAFIDVCTIFKRKEERTLEAACKFYLNKPLEGAHGAENDIIATLDVFIAQLSHYNDLPTELPDLALYTNYDKPMVDIGGRFTIDSDGDIALNFGKHKGKKAKDVKEYLQWMQKSNFPNDVNEIINQILKQ